LLADKPFGYYPIQEKLRQKGLVVHFSATHDYYWTTFVYITVPGEPPHGKKAEDLDPQPWLSIGHPPVKEELMTIPPGARRTDKLRVRAFLGLDCRGRGRTEEALSITDTEFAAAVVENGFRERGGFLAWVEEQKEAQDEATKAKGKMWAAYVHKKARDLDAQLALAWEMHEAVEKQKKAKLSAWEMVCEAADSTCICGGAWALLTEDLLVKQAARAREAGDAASDVPTTENVRASFRRCLQNPCQRYFSIYILGDRSAGKSHLIKPMMSIFGDFAFLRPVGKSNYPFMDIFGKKVCLIDEIRPGTLNLAWDEMLVWLDGQVTPVPMPQNHHKGNKKYCERAPVFATGGEKLRIPVEEAYKQRVCPQKQNDMMDARWHFLKFRHTFDEATNQKVAPCGACFSKWLQFGPTRALPVEDIVVGAPAASEEDAAEEVMRCIAEWIRRGGGAVELTQAALSNLANEVSWAERYRQRHGRLIVFLKRKFQVLGNVISSVRL
jgi:hypothetical protein